MKPKVNEDTEPGHSANTLLGAGRSVDRNVFNESLPPVKCLLSSRIFVAVEVQVELAVQRTTSERWKVHRYCRGTEMESPCCALSAGTEQFYFFLLVDCAKPKCCPRAEFIFEQRHVARWLIVLIFFCEFDFSDFLFKYRKNFALRAVHCQTWGVLSVVELSRSRMVKLCCQSI